MASPKCGKCGSTSISTSRKTLSSVGSGILVYCGGCGAIYSWVPEPSG